jgi:hypothetical protein
MTGPEHSDDDFEAYLQQRSVLPHRLSKAERFEPPPELDRIVLERAKEAIRGSPSTPIYRPARWALPFGLAATVVIAFAVILHMRESGNPLRVAANAPRAVSTSTDSATANGAVTQPRPTAVPAPESPMSAAAPAPESAMSRAVPPPSPSRNAETMRAQRMAPPSAAEPMSAQQVAQAGGQNAERAPTQELERTSEKKADRAREAATQAFISSADKRAANSTVLSKQALPPSQWLEKIAQLRREGRHAEADREVKAFHKVYPDLAVKGDN